MRGKAGKSRTKHHYPSPINATGCVLWFDSTVASSVVSSSGNVSGQIDLGRLRGNASQPTAASQPTVSSGAIVYSSSGTADFLPFFNTFNNATNKASQVTAGACTVALRFKFNSFAAATLASLLTFCMELGASNAGSISFFEVTYTNGVGGYTQGYTFIAKVGSGARAYSSTISFAQATDTTSWHTLVITYNGGTATTLANYTARYDGTSKTIVSSGAFGRVETDLNSMGARVQQGGTLRAFPFDGSLKSVVVFDHVLAAGEITALESYLGAL